MAFTVEVGAVELTKPNVLKWNRSLDQWAGRFTLRYRDADASTTIANNSEVVVKDSGTAVFGGFVQKWSRVNGMVEAEGLDYTSILTKVYVNEVYNNQLIHVVIKDLLDKYAPSLTYTNVYTSTTAPVELRFKNVQLFKALQELAKYDGASFFVDKDKDLNFDVLGQTDSGVNLTKGTNIISDTYETLDDKLINRVKITGGREDYVETDSSNTGDASTKEYTLSYKPVWARVTVDGTEKVGFKEGMKTTADFDYFMDKEAKKIIFNVAPGNTLAIVIEYTYTTPVIVLSEREESVTAYGVYEKVIFDETINKKTEAQSLAGSLLDKYSGPIVVGNVETRINLTADLGETVDVLNANKKIDDAFIVVGLEHNFFSGGRNTIYQLATLTQGVLEMLSELVQRVEALEEANRGESDLTSYFKQFVDDVSLSDDPANNLIIKIRTVNTTNTWFFGVPETFDGNLKFGGGSGKYSANQVANVSS